MGYFARRQNADDIFSRFKKRFLRSILSESVVPMSLFAKGRNYIQTLERIQLTQYLAGIDPYPTRRLHVEKQYMQHIERIDPVFLVGQKICTCD